jgi:hypothetical protein
MGLDLDLGIDGGDRRLGARHLGPAEAGGAMDDLALQIRELDGIIVDDADAPHPGRREIEQHGEPSPPAPSTRTLLASSFSCPASPTSSRITWRA